MRAEQGFGLIACRECWNEGAAVALAEKEEHGRRVAERCAQAPHFLHVAAARVVSNGMRHLTPFHDAAKTAPPLTPTAPTAARI